MSTIASQIIGFSNVCTTVCSCTDQRKHQSTVSLAFVRGIHRLREKCLHLMTSSWFVLNICNCAGITVHDARLAPWSAGTSAGTVMARYGSHIYTGPALKGQILGELFHHYCRYVGKLAPKTELLGITKKGNAYNRVYNQEWNQCTSACFLRYQPGEIVSKLQNLIVPNTQCATQS